MHLVLKLKKESTLSNGKPFFSLRGTALFFSKIEADKYIERFNAKQNGLKAILASEYRKNK